MNSENIVSEQQHLFNEISFLKYDIKSIARIVQNENINISDDELIEWSENVNALINKIIDLKFEVLDYYGSK